MRTAWMLMPKAAVHLNCHFMPRQHDIRGPRQIGPMQPETQAHAVQQPSHNQFRLRVFLRDRPHDL